MRLNGLRLVPILVVVAAGCNNGGKSDDTDLDTDITNVDDSDTVDTDISQDTDDSDTLGDTDTGLAPLTVADLGVGDLVITEFMADPLACADPNGEYVEVYYKGTRAVDLKGLVLTNAAGNTVTNPNTTIVQPESYALLVRQTAAANCYGLTGDWTYPTLSIVEGGDDIKISYGATTFDEVDFRGGDWPERIPGYSLGFGYAPDAALNDDPNTWCPSSETDLLGATSDYGHPREPTSCRLEGSDTAATEAPVDLMLTEVMDYGPDDGIRYVEIYNPNNTAVSLDHWQIIVYNDGNPTRHVIPLTASGLLQPDHTWVLAATSMTSPVLGGAASAPIDPLLVSDGCSADQYDVAINGDGNDAIVLAYNGFAVDAYGVPGTQDTTGWEYTDKVAYRHDNLRSPSAVWSAAEWTVVGTGHWNEASICRFDEPYVPPATTDTGDSFHDSTPLFTGDTFDTSSPGDTDLPIVYDSLTTLSPGELIINEVMIAPTCGDESQYIEVTLLANHNVSLNGLTLLIDASSFTFSDLIGLRPGESTLLWRTPNAQPFANCYFGALTDGLKYSGLNILHSGSLIKIKSGAVILDSVNTTGLTDTMGVSWQFNPDFIDANLTIDPPGTVNNDIVNWCLSADPIAGTNDLGTPLASNSCAPIVIDTDLPPDTDVVPDTDVPPPPKNVTDLVVGDLVITEFMVDPSAPCADENGEYIEVLNHSAFQVDLQGLVVASGSGSGTIGSSLVLNSGGYAMLRRTPAATQCFGNGSAVPTANYPATVALAQAGDFVSIGNGLTTLDLVDFTGWSPISFTGEAWSLALGNVTPTSNDTQANWCHSGTTIGSGNQGSPGLQLYCTP